MGSAHPSKGRHSSFLAARSVFFSNLWGRRAISLASLLIAAGFTVPGSFGSAAEQEAMSHHFGNLQTLAFLTPAMNIDPSAGRGGGDITIVDNSALMPEEGPSGTLADIERPKNATISIYVVQEGDTLSDIAEMFDVSVNTIKWANDIPANGRIKIGQTLTILPVTGIKYTVKKGDTLASVAKKYGADAGEIANFNELDGSAALAAGVEIIIPDGEVPVAVASVAPKRSSSGVSSASPAQAGYYLRPISGGVRSQGIHGYNGVDLAAPQGTPIIASAEGDVIVAKDGGWNGGYGSYVVISHGNGSQTLYSHASSVIVSLGQHVQQGQVIGYVGQTGKATGAHVHFEIRNGPRNPF
jgi:murein DD-endopeptidase MepM/ murein hydrolase activator NlpD